jgi:hypothetical protein
VVATQPQLYEIDRELTEAQETARSFESLWYGELFYEPWVVQYRPGDSHLKVIVRRQSDQQKHGLRQVLLHGDFNEHHRQAVLLRNRTKTVTLVGHRPLKVPSDVAARRRAEGKIPMPSRTSYSMLYANANTNGSHPGKQATPLSRRYLDIGNLTYRRGLPFRRWL